MDRTRGMAYQETVSVETLNTRSKAGTPPARWNVDLKRIWTDNRNTLDRACTRQREVVNQRKQPTIDQDERRQ